MTLRKLASIVSKREGKKVPVSIGNIREVLRILVELESEWYALDDEPGRRDYPPSDIFMMEGSDEKRVRAARRRLGFK